jgi:large subunit ribosomal protein L32
LTNVRKTNIIKVAKKGGVYMAVPKHKTSKQRTNTRYANWKLKTATVGECPQCHESKQPHRVCKKCGYYDGVLKIEVNKEKKD